MIDKVKDDLSQTDDTNIKSVWRITTPKELIDKIPLDNETAKFIEESRKIVSDIIHLKDNKVMVIVGPCSIHNPTEALDYAKELKNLQKDFPNLFIVMRTYFEKPRTDIWWKWLINDPNLDWSFDIELWLEKARKLLLEINKLWLPTAIEFLDTISPQYVWDLITWWAIWARTTESQLHRELASGLSSPIWFKNWTDWWVDIAINAIKASSHPHNFLWATKQWQIALIQTAGNPNLHAILRWWSKLTNYDEVSVWKILEKLESSKINSWIMIDFSHANSLKDYRNQPIVCDDVANQIASWNEKIMSVMIESNILEWNQKFDPLKDDKNDLKYWVSITDSCVSIGTTKEMLKKLDEAVRIRNKQEN